MGCGTVCNSKPRIILPQEAKPGRSAGATIATPNRPDPTEEIPLTQIYSKSMISCLRKKSAEESKNFNVLCWCDDAETLTKIKTNPYSIIIIPGGLQVHLTYVTERTKPPICDCVVYFIKNIGQIIEARMVRSRYRHIWTHYVVCSIEQAQEVVNELNAELVTESQIGERLTLSSDKMMQLLKKVFDSIDFDHSGSIEIGELVKATAALSSDFSTPEIEEMISSIDSNKNGVIEYSEFVEWWQSGRQGAFKLSTFIDSMSKSLAVQVPDALKVLKSMRNSRLLTKEKSIKQLNIEFGKVSIMPSLTLQVEFGTAARREQLLYKALEVFGWLSKEYCLMFSFKTIETLDEGHFMNLITSTIELAVGSLQERALMRKNVDYRVISQGDILHIGVALDLSVALFSPLMRQLEPWQQLLNAPVDQILKFVLKTDSLDDLNNSSFSLEFVHWSKIPRFMLQNIWRFLSKIGLGHVEPVLSQSRDASLSMSFENTDELQKTWFVDQLDQLKSLAVQFSSGLTTLKNLYLELTKKADPDFDVYMRLENLGARWSFTSSEWPSTWEFLSL